MASKVVCHKLYGSFLLLPLPSYYGTNLSMDFEKSFPFLIDQKNGNYDSILFVIDCWTKIVYHKEVSTTIETVNLWKVVIHMMLRYYGLSIFIINNESSLFILKVLFWLCFFLSIKRKLFTAFDSQIDSRTKRQKSIIEIYLWAFINSK